MHTVTVLKNIIRKYSLKCTVPERSALIPISSEKSKLKSCKVLEPEVSFDQDTLELHMSTFPYAVRASLPRNVESAAIDAVKRFDDVCYYTGPNREMYPSLILIDSYKTLEKPQNLTLKNLQLASILAWCYEMVATGFIVTDDVVDHQKTRWKKPCWHELPNIGPRAAIATVQLTTCAFTILKKYFNQHPLYKELMVTLADTVVNINIGQVVDCNYANAFKQSRDINFLSKAGYLALGKYKGHCIMYLNPPIAAALFANFKVDELKKASPIMEKLTIYRQAQNDAWDCFGKYSFLEKHGTDITGGRCTWVSSTALEYANDKQKEMFAKNYGRTEPSCKNVVMQIYKDINMVEKFNEYKRQLLDEIEEDAKQVSDPNVLKLVNLLVDLYVRIDEDFVE